MGGYRQRSLEIHPLVCARCGRTFSSDNLIELTVHHKDHNHENNPADGSNWENLCIYCHDNEHARYLEHSQAGKWVGETSTEKKFSATYNPFADLKSRLENASSPTKK
ncbi:MAG: YajD family HNH nuclease [Magnetococcus sp. DMHC-6]